MNNRNILQGIKCMDEALKKMTGSETVSLEHYCRYCSWGEIDELFDLAVDLQLQEERHHVE